MKRLIAIVLVLLSLSTTAREWSVSIIPSNLAFNCLTFEVESRKDNKSWVMVAGTPVYFSLTDPVQRFGMQRSDYDKTSMGITSLLFGFRQYFGKWYVEPYITGRWVDMNFHMNNKIGWPVNSTLNTDILTANIGCVVGYKIGKRITFHCFAGPEIGVANIQTNSKSISIIDRDWMYNYYIPHEFNEAFPVRVNDRLKIRTDGYDVYSHSRGNIYQSIRIGIGIGYSF
jgi:hypothetical protein